MMPDFEAWAEPTAVRALLASPALADPVATVRTRRLRQPLAASTRARERRTAADWPSPLLLAAGDHPARLLTAWRGDPLALADRGRYLRTLVGLLASGAVDGLEATPDVIEELLYLDATVVESGHLSFLDGRLLIGTVNRAGLSGTIFELADRSSGFTIESALALRLDGLKWMFRLAPDERDTAEGLQSLIAGLDAAYRVNLPVMLEIEWVERRPEGGWRYRSGETELLVGLVGVASAIGPSTVNRWLELPRGDSLAPACRATTLPILALPPERRAPDPSVVFDYALMPEASVQGQLVGRDIMLAADPIPLALAVAAIWRQGLAPEPARTLALNWWQGSAG